MNINLIKKDDCTGCGVCKAICPISCIEMIEDKYDNFVPSVDLDRCIDCGKCINLCQVFKPIEKNKKPTAYAGWSNNNDTRMSSASGGVASEIYRFCQKEGYICCGVRTDQENVYFDIAGENEDASLIFRNSKYVYTQIGTIVGRIKELLSEGKKVCCVGTSCQIASLKNVFNNDYKTRLLLVDLVCHGVSSDKYLKQHVISKAGSKNIADISFRNPVYGTDKFFFTLSDENGVFYKKTPNQADEYQLGYHNGIIYIDNCYKCVYTDTNRVGDITLADYWGIGEKCPFDYDKNNVNMVYACSKEGMNILKKMVEENYISLVERPLDESRNCQQQLREPTHVTLRRARFKKSYEMSKDFDYSIRKAMYLDMKLVGTNHYRKLILLRKVIKKLLRVEL